MIERSHRENELVGAPRCSGFTLIVVLLFLAILLGGVTVLSSFVTLSQRGGAAQRNASSAQQSALFGLNIALGELQSAAGPDTRVTAPASILGSSTYTGNLPPVAGQAAWTGVWKSNTGPAPNGDPAQFNPATPDTKAFVGWLVSATDAAGNFAIPTTLSAPTSNSTLTANQTIALFTNSDENETPYIQAGKVQIDDVPGGKRYFAFAVEDEGVKANLSWSETPASATGNTAERAQASRLSVAPGPDYAAINGTNGPFTSVTYPLSIAGSDFLSNAIAPMRDPADLQVSMNATTPWLKDQRANITWGSKGVLSDVKQGGLRRDLSLAFEMDGTADVSSTSQPEKFNRQDGEFVGGNDRLTAPQVAPGMPVKERFLYRDTLTSGTPFSSDILAGSVVRGPNWWALRDYANLYKRLTGTSRNYTLKARNYYPNRSGGAASLGEITQTLNGGNWDREMGSASRYIYRPARGNYAPVLLGSVHLYSAIATESNGTTAKLALGIDSLFYLWNPFNRTLVVDKFAIFADQGLVGDVAFKVNKVDGTENTYGPVSIWEYLKKNYNNDYLIVNLVSDLTMAPGEIIVVSPKFTTITAASKLKFEATPGTNIDNASGIILTKLPPAWAPVTFDITPTSTDTVQMLYLPGTALSRYWLRTTLPPSTATPSSFGGTGSVNSPNAGDELQALDTTLTSLNNQKLPHEYFYPGPLAGEWVTSKANQLVDTKNFFGIHTYLMKPASHQGNNPNPVEVFSQFNPAPVGSTNKDVWRVCHLNQIFNTVSRAGGFNTLLQEVGINLPATALNNGFWGESYFAGSTSVPMTDIPSAPIFSLAAFSHAALATRTSEPYHALGNSWASVFVPPVSPYGVYEGAGANPGALRLTSSDSSWLLNDALFDRYYLSGIAPAFTIGNGGYSATGSIIATLSNFFSDDYTTALANPVLRPYLPPGKTAADAITALDADDGYKKMGAYSLIDGAFNVNSTSVPAWSAFLRANRNLAVTYAQGGIDAATGSPFPSGTSPSNPNGIPAYWSGFSRLSDAQVANLATEIVNQVKLRGPFMSLSDFVNRRVGRPRTQENDMGALQAAIEAANINSAVQTGAGGTDPAYTSTTLTPGGSTAGNRKTTTGIPGDITQANLLLPLAPRLAARSDTFRIRSYGEVRSTDGTKVISQAACEAIVQRVPEYMDPATDSDGNETATESVGNEPWDEGAILNETNKTLGRRFKVVSFRWLNPNEL